MVLNRGVESAWWALRVGLGSIAFLAGLDKYFNILTDWSAYVSPSVEGLLPFTVPVFLGLVGVIEMLVGIAVLTKWTRVGSYVAMVWLLAISFNLILTGQFLDVAVRDVAMAIGAYTLARLTEARQPVESARISLAEALRAPERETAA
jgi:uncharacterized membrane protein YphA (DoxX/SURF4 family)